MKKSDSSKDYTFDKLASCVAITLEFILKNPLIFFSEADIQAIFYQKLTESKELKKLFETNVSLGMKGESLSKKHYKTLLVHREYGLNDMPNSRADLVIFSQKNVKQITDPINLKIQNEYITPDYVFEFGTEKSASSLSNLAEHICNDLEKLRKASITAFLIHIQRNYLIGNDNTHNKGKHDKYVNFVKITSMLRPFKIKLLYFKVDLGGSKRQIYKQGKIKMYNGEKLIGINQNKIKETIKNYLLEK